MTSCPLALIYSDIWGPSPIVSCHGNHYYVSFIDDFSKYTWLFPISYKSDVYVTFFNFNPWLNACLILKSNVFKLIGVGNFDLSHHF
jgi:hypothetical protein